MFLTIVAEIGCRILGLHEKNVFHRDIKPENIYRFEGKHWKFGVVVVLFFSLL
jgi:serine/threonine protein kinase